MCKYNSNVTTYDTAYYPRSYGVVHYDFLQVDFHKAVKIPSSQTKSSEAKVLRYRGASKGVTRKPTYTWSAVMPSTHYNTNLLDPATRLKDICMDEDSLRLCLTAVLYVAVGCYGKLTRLVSWIGLSGSFRRSHTKIHPKYSVRWSLAALIIAARGTTGGLLLTYALEYGLKVFSDAPRILLLLQ